MRAFPDGGQPLELHDHLVTRAFSLLARRRWAGVGLAILVEAVILLPLAYADPSAVVGIPAAVAAAIAGTVAVVFGPVDGALVAFAGAALFGSVGGWEPGELAALGVWPAIVVAAGLFARRVERQRRALEELMASQESERQRIAVDLHDEKAQMLTAALLGLKQVAHAVTTREAGAANDTTRELIQETIKGIREIAVDLRPRALEDFGLAAAVEQLATSFARRTGIEVDVDIAEGRERLPAELELTIYRAIQEVLGSVVSPESGTVHIVVERAPTNVRAVIEHDRGDERQALSSGNALELASLRERVRIAGGRLVARSGRTGMLVQVELPVRPVS